MAKNNNSDGTLSDEYFDIHLTYIESLIARGHPEEAIRFIHTLKKEHKDLKERDMLIGMDSLL